MDKTIQLKDKKFRLTMPEAVILEAVERVASKMREDLKDKNPVFLVVLNGAFMYAADLLKRVEIPAEVSFVKMSSYSGKSSSGVVSEILGLNVDVKGRTVVIVEDIVDSGLTMKRMTEILMQKGVKELHITTLLAKPSAIKYDVNIEYAALEIPNDFIVGYGLDYDGYGRNLKDIYTVVD